MERIKDSYKLSTGKLIHPNKGIIGLTEYEGFKIYEGYDGTWLTENEVYDKIFVELTNNEQKEIALYMSNLWLTMANNL
jgi:hypothetical protein